MIFHTAAKTCRGCPRLSPGGRPSSASVRLHPSSSKHPAQMLQLYKSLKASTANPKELPPSVGVRGTRLLLPPRPDQPGGRLRSRRTTLRKWVLSAVTHWWGAREGCAGSRGLSNQPSAHPQPTTLSSSPLGQRQLLFHRSVLDRKQSERNDKTSGSLRKRGEEEPRTPPLG